MRGAHARMECAANRGCFSFGYENQQMFDVAYECSQEILALFDVSWDAITDGHSALAVLRPVVSAHFEQRLEKIRVRTLGESLGIPENRRAMMRRNAARAALSATHLLRLKVEAISNLNAEALSFILSAFYKSKENHKFFFGRG